MIVALVDGRTIYVPLTWFPRLLDATPPQRARREPTGAGYGIHWPDLDEDLRTDGLQSGASAAPARQADEPDQLTLPSAVHAKYAWHVDKPGIAFMICQYIQELHPSVLEESLVSRKALS